MRQPIRIRYQLQGNPELAETFRDVQRAFDSQPTVLLRRFDAQFTLPLVIGNLTDEPDEIRLGRIIDLTSQESPVTACSGMCHFVWRPDRGGAQITAISGLTLGVNGGKLYRYTFELVYAPVGGLNV